jgi:hypothetical protein
MKATRVLLAFVAALLGGASCQPGLFRCKGTDPVSGGPLCFCEANGVLCGHSGFDPCLACPVPR